MIQRVDRPTVVPAAGTPRKRIEEFFGLASSGEAGVSIARMVSPAGWREPGQRPEFTEYTVVLRGELRVETDHGELAVTAGQAVVVPAGDWVRYHSPGPGETEYLAVCLPAFAPATVHRDGE